VDQGIRESIEQREVVQLSAFAAKAAESRGRARQIEPDPVRTCYQRDRDRILHSKAFRRLKHKTQVFIDPRGDHYRTRLTHTLEVAQIARTVGRALRLNEDLIEAIALGHDLGHTPFGHPGESALDEAIRESTTEIKHFRHSEQSLRIVDVLEDLNLTHETRSGIAGHSKGANDLTEADGKPKTTLEASVVRICDRIAYLNHDLDDAVRSRIVEEIPERFQALGDTQGLRIGGMVRDLIHNSLDRPEIQVSQELRQFMNDLKDWLFEHVYFRYPLLYPDIAKAQRIVKYLYGHFLEPGSLPKPFEGAQGAVDYVAGMTDRFAIDTFTDLQLPQVWITPV